MRVDPLDSEHPAEGLIFMLHGAGDSGEGMLPLAEDWAQAMPRVAFVMPSAPMRGQLSAWFGKRSVTKEICSYENVERQLLKLLDAERRRLGLRLDQVALWGYSAGSMMASRLALLLPEACAALILLHGICQDNRLPPPPSQLQPSTDGQSSKLGRPPALVLSGEHDRQVPAEVVKRSSETLRDIWGFEDVTYMQTPGQDHSIGDDEYTAMQEFLISKLCMAAKGRLVPASRIASPEHA